MFGIERLRFRWPGQAEERLGPDSGEGYRLVDEIRSRRPPEDAPEPIRPLRTIRIEQLDSSRVVRIGPPGEDTEAVSETVCRVMSSAASDTLEAASSM